MSKSDVQKIRKTYGIGMAVYSGIVGLLFIWQVWSIFRSAPENPYTVASITAAFHKIAVPVWIWIIALIGGFFIPAQETEKIKANVSSQTQIERLQKRMVLDEEEQKAIKAMERFRSAMSYTMLIVWVIVLAVGIYFFTNASYEPRFDKEFFREHNALVDRIVCFVPWVIGGIVVSILAVIKTEKSRILEIILLKNMLAEKAKIGGAGMRSNENMPTEAPLKSTADLSADNLKITRMVIGVIGLVFVVFGVFNGGMSDVLEKAVKICTQCIGLG